MSFSIPFPPIPNGSFPFPIPFQLVISISSRSISHSGWHSASSLQLCCWPSVGSSEILKVENTGLWQSSVSLSVEVPGEADVAPLTVWFSSSDCEWGKCVVFIPSHSNQAFPIPIPIPFPWYSHGTHRNSQYSLISTLHIFQWNSSQLLNTRSTWHWWHSQGHWVKGQRQPAMTVIILWTL